jgi:hypothetical protein
MSLVILKAAKQEKQGEKSKPFAPHLTGDADGDTFEIVI